MYIDKTTHEERITICKTMLSIIDDVEQARGILSCVLTDYFEAAEQKQLNEEESKRVALFVGVAEKLIVEGLSRYRLMVCDDWGSGGEQSPVSLEHIILARKSEDVFYKAAAFASQLPEKQGRQMQAAIQEIGTRPDEEAITFLEAMMAECQTCT